ncbi:MAG: SRPBCC domain-containing protein [Anaerolineales bacterium]|nr:SRPBCC domain-containing protein [Anaerolineales bacterium]MCW5854879.1 SRPBCC domain-containing protein [Anaerolineales bacterium]
MRSAHDPQELRIHFEIEINAPPAKVWAKMATLEGMHQWLARNLVFEHQVGGRFEMKGNLPGEGPYRFTGEVVTLMPEQELAFTWKHDPEEGEAWPVSTLVTLRLTPTDRGTRVTLTHTGFEELGTALGKGAYEGHIQGWTMSENLSDLKAAVEAD